ncbi:hypothetical protein ACLKA6_013097 [Drosophila palustris]
MHKVACLLIVALFGVVYAFPSQYDTDETWVAGNLSYPLPSNVLVGGLDPYGYKLYVGRVKSFRISCALSSGGRNRNCQLQYRH